MSLNIMNHKTRRSIVAPATRGHPDLTHTERPPPVPVNVHIPVTKRARMDASHYGHRMMQIQPSQLAQNV